MFINSTLQSHWLSRMRTSIHELVITGGNLRYISPEAFLTQFAGNIRYLVLEKIVIMTWDPNTLVGLSSLKQLIIQYANIHDIQRNALEAVDDTLETLRITANGIWNPINLTGTADLVRLTTVDLSSNLFSHVIRQESFSNLNFCQVLFLNSCGIKSIGIGTFDYLTNIKILHLNNNFLVTVPIGLFKSIASNVNVRVNLQGNRWLCDCALPDLRLLSDNKMMLLDPMCHFPEHVRGKSLREFYNKCVGYSAINDDEKYSNNFKYIYFNGSCTTEEYNLSPLRVISSIDDFLCPKSRFTQEDLKILKYSMESTETKLYSKVPKPNFTVKIIEFSMIQISSTQLNNDFGIVWHHTKCPHEIYCLKILPNYLWIYDIDVSSLYTFCPLRLSTGLIQFDECIISGPLSQKHKDVSWTTFYILTATASLVIGAFCIYLIIRLYPSFLNLSYQILFLKYKNVAALDSPPKIPLTTISDKQITPEFNNTQVFVIAGKK